MAMKVTPFGSESTVLIYIPDPDLTQCPALPLKSDTLCDNM